jgi:hypothetical protein
MATKTKSERFELRVDEDQLSAIDSWAAEQSDQPTRAEAVRRLLGIGLSAGSRRAVQFSDGEKMLMLMMVDLYKSLKVKGDINPTFLAEVIYGGHYWAPKWDMQGVFHNHIDNPNDVDYVVNVLDMWSYIELSLRGRSTDEKLLIEEATGKSEAACRFNGFDGNNETTHMSIANFLISEMGRFLGYKDMDLNSHCPKYTQYSKMLEKFLPMRRSLAGGLLSTKQLISLLEI